ncbi:MAG TPA: NADH-quinone oxidoreductase subunit NuoG [Armatimonadota bacterium]
MPTIYIDNEPYTIEDESKSLLETCLSLGFDIPYFCWHPAMHSVGACRQCAVKLFKDEQDTRGKIVMSCMTPAKDGTRISIDDADVRAFRASVIEWLMTNHPHDCPVCDEGGECHLQDMTVMTGHVYRRYRFKKRTYRNQDLGPFVNHEMNRCIQCYRCVRFYKDYAGGHDLDVFGWHDHVYFGRHVDGVLENEFSGNLVEVCPTGVFTDKTLKQHYTRKWDLQTAPSLCTLCGMGCNTIPGERYGTVRRIRNRYHHAVNGYFLCDRGRYGYEFVNSPQRVRQPLQRGTDGTLQPVAAETALHRLAPWLRSGKVIGIGSPRASLEANFALQTLVGAPQFYLAESALCAGLTHAMLTLLQRGPCQSPSLREVESADAILILGEDVTNVAPRLALALRQAALQRPKAERTDLHLPAYDDFALREAIQQQRSPCFIATPDATKLDELATASYHAAPDDIARLGMAVAHALDAGAPDVPGLAEPQRALATQIADALRAATRPLIIAGSSCGSEAIIQAAANVAQAAHTDARPAALCYLTPECNTLGLALLGGKPLDEALTALRAGTADTLIILEADLYRVWDRVSAQLLLRSAKHVIVLDQLPTETTEQAELVFPAATFAEADGTLVNFEGRAQRFFQVLAPKGEVAPSWRWLGEMLVAAGKAPSAPWPTFDHLVGELAQLAAFTGVDTIAPTADFRLVGEKVARQPHRYSGRTAMQANISVHEPKPPADPDSPLAFSMEGFQGQPPAPLIPRFWAPGWNSVQSVNKFQQEVGGPLRGGDPGLRLIAPASSAPSSYFSAVPQAFATRVGEWLLLPAYHLFGSEPLSLCTPGVAQRAPKPYIAVSAQDADRAGWREGQLMEVTLYAQRLHLGLRIHQALPAGVALLPVGLSGLVGLLLPGWGRIVGIGEHGAEGSHA